jgi:hypothetical protein
MQLVLIMNKLLSILFLIVILFSGCASGRKDSYSSKGNGRKVKIKFKDNFSSKSKGRTGLKMMKDSFSGAPKKKSPFKWKDSFSGGGSKRKSKPHNDSYSGGRQSKKRKSKRRGTYGTSPTKRVDFSKRRDAYSGGSNKRKLKSHTDSYSNDGAKKYKMGKRDSYGSSRKNSNKGYKNPNKKWWNFFGKKTRHGKRYKSRKSYGGSRKRKKVKKKKVKLRTDFEGL